MKEVQKIDVITELEHISEFERLLNMGFTPMENPIEPEVCKVCLVCGVTLNPDGSHP